MSSKFDASFLEIEEAQRGLKESIEQSRRLVARADELIDHSRDKVGPRGERQQPLY